jgi:hypothetical protein
VKYKKNQKPKAVDVLFKAYPMVPLSYRSNLAGWYLSGILKNIASNRLLYCGPAYTVL